MFQAMLPRGCHMQTRSHIGILYSPACILLTDVVPMSSGLPDVGALVLPLSRPGKPVIEQIFNIDLV